MVNGFSMIDGLISWMSVNLEALAALLSASATIALALLYRQQKEILNDQKEFLKLERLPEVELSDQSAKEDELEVGLSNYGHGIAKNIRFCTSISAPNSNRIEPALAESRAHRLNAMDSTTLEQAVNPHESGIRFRGTPSVAYRLDGEMRRFANFSTAFEELDDDEIDAIWYQIYLVVDDQLGGCQSKPVYSYPRYPSSLSVKRERLSLEEIYNHSGLIPMDEDPGLPSPNCHD